MKKLLLMLILVLLLSPSAWAAFSYNGTSSKTVVNDGAALTLPNAPWTIACMIKLTSNAGTGYQPVLNWASGGGEEFLLRIGQASHATDANDLVLFFTDSSSHTGNQENNNNAFASNTSWTSIIVERDSTNIALYVNNTSVSSLAIGSMASLDSSATWRFGANGGETIWLNGALAECAKWDKGLTAGERNTLNKRFSPNCPMFLNSRKWFVPMIRDVVELSAALTVTNTNVTIVDHPPIMYCGE